MLVFSGPGITANASSNSGAPPTGIVAPISSSTQSGFTCGDSYCVGTTPAASNAAKKIAQLLNQLRVKYGTPLWSGFGSTAADDGNIYPNTAALVNTAIYFYNVSPTPAKGTETMQSVASQYDKFVALLTQFASHGVPTANDRQISQAQANQAAQAAALAQQQVQQAAAAQAQQQAQQNCTAQGGTYDPTTGCTLPHDANDFTQASCATAGGTWGASGCTNVPMSCPFGVDPTTGLCIPPSEALPPPTPVLPPATPMSTGTKLAIGGGIVAAIGLAVLHSRHTAP